MATDFGFGSPLTKMQPTGARTFSESKKSLGLRRVDKKCQLLLGAGHILCFYSRSHSSSVRTRTRSASEDPMLKDAGASGIGVKDFLGTRTGAFLARARARRSSFSIRLPESSRGINGVQAGFFHVPRSICRASNSTRSHLYCIIRRMTSLTKRIVVQSSRGSGKVIGTACGRTRHLAFLTPM